MQVAHHAQKILGDATKVPSVSGSQKSFAQVHTFRLHNDRRIALIIDFQIEVGHYAEFPKNGRLFSGTIRSYAYLVL